MYCAVMGVLHVHTSTNEQWDTVSLLESVIRLGKYMSISLWLEYFLYNFKLVTRKFKGEGAILSSCIEMSYCTSRFFLFLSPSKEFYSACIAFLSRT